MNQQKFNYRKWFIERLDVIEKKLDALIFLEQQRASTELKGYALQKLLNCYERTDKAGLMPPEPMNSEDIEFIGILKHKAQGHYCHIEISKDIGNG